MLLKIKRVPTVVSNHQKDETAEEEEGEGCGRNILSKCCINVERLPLYTCKPAEENVTFLESLLLGEWEDRFQRGLFRYDVTACETKVIPGKYGFIAQLNEGRHLKKRPTEFRVDKVLQPFDANKFNFTKVCREELLFQFEADMPLDVDNSPNVVAINVSPIEYGHVLLIPRVLDCLPQRIDHKSLLLALHMAVEAANPYFRVGYNSLGAFATINHLHFQAYYLAMPFPIEKAHSLKITTTNDGVRISKLMSYPVRGLLFEGGNSIKELSDDVSNASVCLQNNNISFNILISDSGKRIFLLPQCYAEKQALGGVSSELLDTQVNPAVWEMSGHMVLKRKKDYEGATEEKARSLLAEVSLSEERFKEVNTMIFEAIGCSAEEEEEEELEEESSISGGFIRVNCCISVKEEAVSN
ncbi:GDP-L-galactose phosphorylase 2 [Brassica rapa]|uniref:GDP-L-galactose phosphorylase 2 n=1 Tax=Brassica campestris TaxID=3711 RepID=UPI0004F19149|nr:GDP-L-galactose phosphorylase 2 [Brassica rapa]